MAKAIRTKNTRAHKRLKTAFLVKYETGRAGEPPRITNIKDISAGGIKFITQDTIPNAHSMKLNLMAPPLGKPLEAEAQVVRVNRNKRTFVYTVAVNFTKISEKERGHLDGFIEELAKNRDTQVCIDQADVVLRRKGK